MTVKTVETEKKGVDVAQGENVKAPQVRWSTVNLKSSYANVCTATSTREEVVLNFGINQTWERGMKELEIELTNRIILSPFAAMRTLETLKRLMAEYQTRYGELKQDMPAPGTSTRQ